LHGAAHPSRATFSQEVDMAADSQAVQQNLHRGPVPLAESAVAVQVGRRISWGAVFAGVALALVMQVVLAMLGAGIGLSTIDPAAGQSPEAGTLGMAAGIWWAVSMLVALYIGGWVAGHMAGMPQKADGRLHGLVVWALTVLLMLYLLTSTLGGVIGGAFNTFGNMAAQGSQAAAAAGPNVLGAIADKAREAGVPVDAMKPGGQGVSEQQKAEAAQKGREAADRAAGAGAQAGLWGALALLLGAIAAAVGGSSGRPRDLVLRP
jgi:hypothetical protein